MTKKPTENELRRIIDLAEPVVADGYVLYLRRSDPDRKKRGKNLIDEESEKPTRIDEVSIDQQRKYCREYAARKGLNIVKEFAEVASAKKPDNRDEFKKMLAYFQQHEGLGVLSWAPDRLSRNALEAGMLIQLHLEKQIIDFQFCTYYFHQDSSGLEHLMMEFARAMGYSLRLSKTVTRGMWDAYHTYKREISRPKFGYDRLVRTDSKGVGRYVNFSVPHRGENGRLGEFDAVQMAFALRIKGWTGEKIAAYLSSEPYYTKTGKKLKINKQRLLGKQDPKDVEKIGILRDTVYYGLRRGKLGEVDMQGAKEQGDNGEMVEFVPAVSEEDFLACQAVNDRRRNNQTIKHDDLPFKGLIRCGHCNYAITPQEKKEQRYVYYYCTRPHCDGAKQHAQSKGKKTRSGITGAELFDMVGEIFRKKFKPTKKDMTAYLLLIERNNKWNRKNRDSNVRSYNAQIVDIDKQLDKLGFQLGTALAEVDDEETKAQLKKTFKARMNDLKLQRKAKASRVEKLLANDEPYTLDVAEWLELMEKLYSKWKKASLGQKQRIAESIFLELVIKDGKIASYSCKDAYKALENANLSYDGGRPQT